jgi:hypothetical protein
MKPKSKSKGVEVPSILERVHKHGTMPKLRTAPTPKPRGVEEHVKEQERSRSTR